MEELIKNCEKETYAHIEQVNKFIHRLLDIISFRGVFHDRSKLQAPELETFAEYTPKLKTSTYGSDEYKGYLQEMGKALQHHYKTNRHHPEHFQEGIRGMNLADLTEMLCDWKAATLRHANGDIRKSIEQNQQRFGYSDDLKQILLNTVELLENE